MNWIKQNTFLSGLIALLVIGIGGLGFFFTKARGEFTDAKDRLAAAYTAKRNLQQQKPFPNTENAAVVRDLVSDYRKSAEAIANKLYVSQVPMPTGVRVAQFQEDLALKVDAVVEASAASGVTLPEGFYLGLDKYRAQVPLEGAVDQLQFQLDATVWLSNLLLANDVKRMSVKRQQMAFETRAEAPAPAKKGKKGAKAKKAGSSKKAKPVSVTYPMELAIELPEKNFQAVLNALSNTSSALGETAEAGEYYFVNRWMRVENKVLIGPERSEQPDVIEVEEGDAPAEPESQGINMVFGRENVNVYMALDLVRFLPKVTVE